MEKTLLGVILLSSLYLIYDSFTYKSKQSKKDDSDDWDKE